MDEFKLILIHQLLFQGMFLTKNIYLSKKLGVNIKGKNSEAITSTIFFTLTIIIALVISYFDIRYGKLSVVADKFALSIALFGMVIGTIISGAALVGLKDSWRVGVIEEHKTELVTSGIYKYSRNPYFTSYILVFLSYAVLLQNMIIIVCTIVSTILVHKMILKEESYLHSIHGSSFSKYKKSTPRYLVV